jgi:hypothetical protein
LKWRQSFVDEIKNHITDAIPNPLEPMSRWGLGLRRIASQTRFNILMTRFLDVNR